ncbi:MAG: hypothetical protein JWP43_891 [Ramlibacter sp.]|nr:hypothetical protein [Ramlibacter sp.]
MASVGDWLIRWRIRWRIRRIRDFASCKVSRHRADPRADSQSRRPADRSDDSTDDRAARSRRSGGQVMLAWRVSGSRMDELRRAASQRVTAGRADRGASHDASGSRDRTQRGARDRATGRAYTAGHLVPAARCVRARRNMFAHRSPDQPTGDGPRHRAGKHAGRSAEGRADCSTRERAGTRADALAQVRRGDRSWLVFCLHCTMLHAGWGFAGRCAVTAPVRPRLRVRGQAYALLPVRFASRRTFNPGDPP